MDFWLMATLAAGAFLVAGTIKGLVGIGLPTASIALMTLFLPPRMAIALILIPMIGSNFWQMIRGGDVRLLARRYGTFAVVLAVTVTVTALAARDVPDRFLTGALGAVILLFVAASWRGWVPALRPGWDRAAQIGFGAAAGAIGGLTSAWAAPLTIYLSTRRVQKDEFVAASGFLIVCGSVPLTMAYAWMGLLDTSAAGLSAALLIPTILGFSIGEAWRRKMSGTAFRQAVLIVFAVLGLNLLRRSIFVV